MLDCRYSKRLRLPPSRADHPAPSLGNIGNHTKDLVTSMEHRTINAATWIPVRTELGERRIG